MSVKHFICIQISRNWPKQLDLLVVKMETDQKSAGESNSSTVLVESNTLAQLFLKLISNPKAVEKLKSNSLRHFF